MMGARLSGSDLREAQLGPLMISAERLMPADLSRLIAKGTDFSQADLRQAKLIFADLSRANFSGANLRQTDLTGANKTTARGIAAQPVTFG
jgi:uncharacterized protein YjbI with pentapeptide repeats